MPKSTLSKTFLIKNTFNFFKKPTKNFSNVANQTTTLLKKNKRIRTTTIFAAIVLVVLVPIIILTLRKGEQAAAWFDESYQYRKAVAITNSSGSNLTDFQSSFTLDTAALVTAGKMQSDCDDIRITDVNGQILPFWIEENNPGCNQSATVVWTKVPSIPTSGATVYVYYGNPNSANAQKGENVFEFFDDFSQNTIGSKWTVQSGTWSISGGELRQTVNNVVNRNIYVNYSHSNIVIETRQKTLSTGIADYTGINARDQGTGARYLFNWNNLGTGDVNVYKNTGTDASEVWTELGTSATYGSLDRSSYHKLKATMNGSSLSTCVDSTCTTTTDATYASGTRIGLRSEGDNRFDYYFVRKYASTDPSLSAGSEELGKAPIAYWKLDEGQGSTTYDTMGRNNGTLGVGSSAPQWKSESECITGKCLYFDGSNDFFSITTPNIQDTPNKFTIEGYIRPAEVNARFIGPTTNGVDNYIAYNANNKTLDVAITESTDLNNRTRSSANNTVLPNIWTHWAVSIDDKDIKIYINGKLNAQFTETIDIGTWAGPWIIGARGNKSVFYQGYLDDVKVYPYARTAAEIKNDYNNVSSTQGTSASTVSQNQGGDLSNGLVGYWKMDENTGTSASDASGNSNTLTLSTSSWTTGKYGTSWSGSGSSYLSRADDSDFDFTNTDELTISLWYKTSSTTNAADYLVTKYSLGSDLGYYLSFDGSSGTLSFITGDGLNFDSVSTSADVYDAQWHHVSVVKKGTTDMRLYLDGVLQSTDSSITSGDFSTGTLLYVGDINGLGGGNAFNGTIDELRIYRRALNPTDVSALYNFAPGPVGYYKLDDGSGTAVIDASGSGINGTLGTGSSAPSWSSGKYGGALRFDGSNDTVNISSSDLGYFTKSATVCLWINRSGTSLQERFFSSRSGNPRESFELHTETNNDLVRFDLGDGSTASSLQGTASIPVGVWTHICGVRDLINTKRYIYVNGKLDATEGTLSVTGDINPTQTTLGNLSTSSFYGGLIDDVKIYNYARTQSQILQDYNADHPNVGTPVGSTVLNLKFDEGYGTTAYDKSPQATNGNLGTGTSAPSWTNSGKFGKALTFDGADDYVSVANTTANQNMDVKTITAWIKINGLGENSAPRIIDKRQAGTGWEVQYKSDSNQRLELVQDFSGSAAQWSTPANSLSSGVWTYIAVVYDRTSASNAPIMYINGKSQTITTIVAPSGTASSDSSNQITIGNRAAADRTFDGTIDEVKVYPFALTADEIKLDYNQGKLDTMGSISTASDGITASNGADRAYCVPGDTSTCNAPVAEWLFNENTGTTANDTGSGGRNGTFGASSAAPTWTFGKYGNGVHFNGSQYINTSTQFSFSTLTSFTLSGWYKFDEVAVGGWAIDRSDGADEITDIYQNGDDISFVVRDDNKIPDNAIYATASNVLVANTWYHVVGVRDVATDKIYLYLNGELKASATDTTGTTISPTLRLGAHYAGTGPQFSLDDVRVYDYARTPAQIAWEFSRGAPVAYYKFDECQGTTINDWGPNGNGGYNGNNLTFTVSGSGSQTATGTCSSSGAWNNGASGKFNSALSLDGTDDTAKVSDPSSGILDFADGENFTVSVWVKPTAVSTNQVVFAKKNGTANTLIGYLGYINNQGKVVFVAATNSSNNISLFSNNLVTAGVWTHLTYVYTGASNTVKVYINGQDAGGTPTVTGDPASLANSVDFAIGTESDDQVPFAGLIDDLKLYRYALTQDQIQTDMSGGAVSFR